jgi:hypothetical protein
MQDGVRASFSFGSDSSDSGAGTSNGFFIGGALHKLDQVSFHVPGSNWMQPWRFTSNDGRLRMIFTPHQERVESHALLAHRLRRRQYCGIFSGYVILDDGGRFEFDNMTGFAERRMSKH